MSNCPSCANRAVGPSGSKLSEVLIIGESPSREDLSSSKPFVGPVGFVLRKELALHGVDLFQLRCVNMWIHEPNKNENCFNAGIGLCLQEAKGKQAILLLGADTVMQFTGYKVSDVNGLQVESPMLSAPVIYAGMNPGITFHKSLGETRFAITNFVKHIQNEGWV